MAEGSDDSVLSGVASEFTCSICCDLFVMPHTLPCSHSFCQSCLVEWMSRKKECAICRKEITSQPVYCLVLENAVDRYAETLSPELKLARRRRKENSGTFNCPPQEDIAKPDNSEEIPWGSLAVGAIAGAAITGLAVAGLAALFAKPKSKK